MQLHQLDISGRHSTGDPNLACALLTNGVPLDFAHPIDKVKGEKRDYLRFHFMPATIDGKRRTVELCAAWDGGQSHIDRHPEDGMSYCMAFAHNRKQLMDLILHEVPQVVVRKGRQIALLSENAGPRLEAEILGRLK